jgi:hypothetical protein
VAVYEDKRPNRQGKLVAKGYWWADRDCWAEGFEGPMCSAWGTRTATASRGVHAA